VRGRVKFEMLAEATTDRGFGVYATTDVMNFIKSLDDVESDLQKVTALIETVANSGPPQNYQKSKKLFDDIYELKSYQIRLAYIYGERRRTILLIHAIRKKADEWPKNEKKVAKRVRAEVLMATNKGTISYGK